MKHWPNNICSAFLLISLAACGGGGGSGGSPETPTVNLTGTAGKGLLIGADVRAYEVISGTQSQTAWGTTRTGTDGRYVLKGAPTNNPIVVVVTTNSSTLMLDESQPQTDGTFRQISAAPDLKLRSFVEALNQNDSVQVNPLTETAIALALNAQDSSGARIGLTKNSLLAAKQIAQQLAPSGVNPFAIALPSRTSDLLDNNVAKMGLMMTGLIQNARDEATSCALQCQVEKLAQNTSMTLDTSGKGSIATDKSKVMLAQKVALLTIGQTVLANSDSLSPELRTSTKTTADGAVTQALTDGISGTAMATADYEKQFGLPSFIETLRSSFKTTQVKLQTAKESLETKYHGLTLQGLDKLSSIVSTVIADCVTGKTQFSCTKTSGSNVTWIVDGGDWVGTATSSEGYIVSGRVHGTVSQDSSVQITLVSGTIKDGTKTLVDIKNVTGTVAASSTSSAGKATLNGSVQVFDQALGSDLAITLALSNMEITADTTLKTFNLKGQLDLTSNKNDALTGTIDSSGVIRTLTQTYYGYNSAYTYSYTDNYTTKASFSLMAKESSQGEILALNANGSQALHDMTQVESWINYPTYDITASATLAANTKLTVTAKRPGKNTLTQQIEVQSGVNKLSLSGQFGSCTGGYCGYDSTQWCSMQLGALLCTDTLFLSANDGTYTATVKKSSTGITADLYKGNSSTGIKIGAITSEGLIQIYDGTTTKEYSLY